MARNCIKEIRREIKDKSRGSHNGVVQDSSLP